MADYISKQDVIDYLNGYLHSLGYGNTDMHVNGQRGALINAIQDISAAKAADVQPVRRGRWETPVSVGNGIKFCSVCRNEAYWDTDYGQQLFDFCPYCGARMDKS